VSLNGDTNQTTNTPQWTGLAMPVACSFDRLTMTLFTFAGGSTNNITGTLVKNGTDTGLSCTAVSNATTGGAAVTCSASSPTVAAAVGDILGIHMHQTNSTPGVRIGVGTRCN